MAIQIDMNYWQLHMAVAEDNNSQGNDLGHGETSEKNACTIDVWLSLHMTRDATGEIQKYNFGHSICKYIMYWDSPDLYLRACQILTKQYMKSYRFQCGGIPLKDMDCLPFQSATWCHLHVLAK